MPTNPLPKETRNALLAELATAEGYASVDVLLAEALGDSLCPSICTNPDCLAIDEMEPDQDAGWCEGCDNPTQVSCLILAGIL